MCKLCQLCVCKTLPAVCKSCVCKCCQLCMCVVCKHYQLCVYLVSTSRVSEWLSESVRKEKYRTGVPTARVNCLNRRGLKCRFLLQFAPGRITPPCRWLLSFNSERFRSFISLKLVPIMRTLVISSERYEQIWLSIQCNSQWCVESSKPAACDKSGSSR